MVFQVPASKASINQNRFEFELDIPAANGKSKKRKFSLPKMQFVSSDVRHRMQRVGVKIDSLQKEGETVDPALQVEAAEIQRELIEKYAPGLYELVTDDQLQAIQEAWQEASNIGLGESSPSAD